MTEPVVHALEVRFSDGEMEVNALCGAEPDSGRTVALTGDIGRVTCKACLAILVQDESDKEKVYD